LVTKTTKLTSGGLKCNRSHSTKS